MTRKPLRKHLLIGLVSLIIGIVCLYYNSSITDSTIAFAVMIAGVLLSIFGLFLIILFIAPGTVLKIFGQS
jgi:hypothetical protein